MQVQPSNASEGGPAPLDSGSGAGTTEWGAVVCFRGNDLLRGKLRKSLLHGRSRSPAAYVDGLRLWMRSSRSRAPASSPLDSL